MAKSKILIVEDDRSLSGILEYNLTNAGFEVFAAYDGQDALNQARLKMPNAVLLDVMLPVFDGMEVCRRLRAAPETRELPILMLTARGEETDQLVGFSVGADDYMVKPFSVKILLERLKSLLRRHQSSQSHGHDVVCKAGVTIDRTKHRVTMEGKPVDLTPSEFRLLDTMIRQPGRAFDRGELIDAALGADTLILERTIDVHIRSLRKKMGDGNQLIQTVRGIGYRFQDGN
jgi:two-component system phosphate regulon response regulator PhoB